LSLIGLDTFFVIVTLGIGPPTRFHVDSCKAFPSEGWQANARAYWNRTGIDPAIRTWAYVCDSEEHLAQDDAMHREIRRLYRESVLLDLPADANVKRSR
jgi:hypothetical protein